LWIIVHVDDDESATAVRYTPRTMLIHDDVMLTVWHRRLPAIYERTMMKADAIRWPPQVAERFVRRPEARLLKKSEGVPRMHSVVELFQRYHGVSAAEEIVDVRSATEAVSRTGRLPSPLVRHQPSSTERHIPSRFCRHVA